MWRGRRSNSKSEILAPHKHYHSCLSSPASLLSPSPIPPTKKSKRDTKLSHYRTQDVGCQSYVTRCGCSACHESGRRSSITSKPHTQRTRHVVVAVVNDWLSHSQAHPPCTRKKTLAAKISGSEREAIENVKNPLEACRLILCAFLLLKYKRQFLVNEYQEFCVTVSTVH